MRIGHKLILGLVAVAVLLVVVGYVSISQLHKIANPMNKDIPQIIGKTNEASAEIIDLAVSKTQNLIKTGTLLVSIFVVIALTSAILTGLVLFHSISNPLARLKAAAAEIGAGKLDTKIEINSKDEIGELAASLNDMTQKLKGSHTNLEEKVKVGTSELSSDNVKLEDEDAVCSLAQQGLQHRIKQLNCFYGLSKLIEQPNISLEQIFQETVHLIRNTYQYPDVTSVRITFDGIHYKTDNFGKSELSQYANIKVRGDETGTIEAYYLGEQVESDEGPFLKEERDLLDVVAERLGSIAERRQAAEKLQLFRSLIDQSNDCIFVVGPKWGRLLDVNGRACDNLGYTREELLDMTVKDIDELIPDDSLWQQHIEKLRIGGDITIEGRHRRKDATTFSVEISLKLVTQGKEDYIMAVARDITERKQAEQQQAHLLKALENTNKELKDFAYVISHDLKAPLRGIKTLADWISDDYADKLDENGKEQMQLLLNRVSRMHDMIEGVLEYSRVGGVKSEQVQIDLNDIVTDVIDIVAAPENIEITVENELPVVKCDETRIVQVFQNLLSNAIKYMDKQEGKIKIDYVEEDGFGKFSVTDNGPGIEQKNFERIFRIFQTLSPRDEFESTGVGLTVVKKIVELYNGKVWVESEPGKGSTFFFTLPKQQTGLKDAKLETSITC